jgi:UDP-N-acetyl-D-galactosamine dehydrogenase
MISNTRIAVIGLGYVGLPLARLFATKYPVVGRHQVGLMDCFPVRIVLEISEEVLQAVLLDKNPLRLWRFTKSKKRINESSNQRFVLSLH